MHQNTAQMLIAGTILVASHAVILAQDVASMPWNVEDELWETASDLWEHEKYSNALFGYEDWLSEQTNLEDTRCAIAHYRIAFCAIQLQQNDASRRVETFFSNYPENPLGQKIQWELANYLYRKRDWKDAINAYNGLNTLRMNSKEVMPILNWKPMMMPDLTCLL